MGKQKLDRTKKILGTLLLAIFVISITATAVSAVMDPNWGPISKQKYDEGYDEGSYKGYPDGYKEGKVAGDLDCKTGKPKGDKFVTREIAAKSSAAYDQGYADGYNELLREGYDKGYTKGYDDCIAKGEQNKMIARQ